MTAAARLVATAATAAARLAAAAAAAAAAVLRRRGLPSCGALGRWRRASGDALPAPRLLGLRR